MILRTVQKRTSLLFYRCYSVATIDSSVRVKTKRDTKDFTSRDHILLSDILSFLHDNQIEPSQTRLPSTLRKKYFLPQLANNVELKNIPVLSQTSEGDGLALVNRSSYSDDDSPENNLLTVIKVPKALPGDVINVRLKRHHEYFAEAELLDVARTEKRQSHREDFLVVCPHFQDCSGCQLQMMPYYKQLEFKQSVIERAYKYFYPELNREKIDNFGTVYESPAQYSYRTKLTPHPLIHKEQDSGSSQVILGFNNAVAGGMKVDVERCPIATNPINERLAEVKHELMGQIRKAEETGLEMRARTDFIFRDSLRVDHETGEHKFVCLTERGKVATEKIGDFLFQFPVNEFFQNNRSILPSFLDFLRYHLLQIPTGYKYIVDTYCGSGFLGISLSSTIPDGGKVFGIEISAKSIEYAKHNADLNKIKSPEKIEFVAGNSDSIFANEQFLNSGVLGEDSVVFMNPSRKGSTEIFLRQLINFRPKAIFYISCNVFTQARDLATLNSFGEIHGVTYKIKTIVGFDFYPQTKHVESVAVLELQK